MKVRLGFVSNSSSASFCVIGKKPIPDSELQEYTIGSDTITIPDDLNADCVEFDWGVEDITDIGSRICFAWCQAMYMQEKTAYGRTVPTSVPFDMLEFVIKEKFKVDHIVWNLTQDRNEEYGDKMYCYIDHQSAATEGENTEIFDNLNNLKSFLFCEDSSIHLDNDNH